MMTAILGALGLGAGPAGAAGDGRITVNFDEGWKFHFAGTKVDLEVPKGLPVASWRFCLAEGVTSVAEALAKPVPDSGWRAVNPGDDEFDNKKGFGWFKAALPDLPGIGRTIYFSMVDDNGVVFLNGVKLTTHAGWDDPFEVSLDQAWKKDGPNELVVLVENTGGPGRMGPAVVYNADLPAASPAEAGPGYADGSWRTVDVPHDWSIELPILADAACGRDGGFFQNGLGWYRKEFTAPADWKDRLVSVEFDGIYQRSEVWINGHYLGIRPFGYSSFRYDLTPYLVTGGRNVLAVRVDNSKQRNSRWYSGSGIYRHVRMVVTDQVHVGHWGVFVTTPEVTADSAIARIATKIGNESGAARHLTLTTRVLNPAGKQAGVAEESCELEPGRTHEFAPDIRVPRPALWSPDAPSLYRAVTEVAVNGAVVDRVETVFGIRTIKFDAKTGFTLNGKPVEMKGGCCHHDNGPLGAASYDRAEERRVEIMKASGFNAIRTSHNPPSPGLLEACDRLGMLVIDEAFDAWREAKLGNDYHRYFTEWWQRDLDTLVLRDRNHPCVVVWSTGNEIIERAKPSGHQASRMLADRIRELDPTRPVTEAICGSWTKEETWEMIQGSFAPLDVGGYNYQAGNYEPDHAKYPDRVMFATESTAGEAFEYWMKVRDLPYVVGDFIWTGWDYLGEASIGNARYEGDGLPENDHFPWNQAYCGDIDICGFKRAQSYYRDILWGAGSKVYIAVHAPIPEGKEEKVSYWGWPDERPSWTWDGVDGKTLAVRVYSACEKVELLLNGKPIGAQDTSRQTKFLATFQVPYAPGTLKAVGYSGGRKVAECELKTAGKPAALRLSSDRARIRAAKGDLAYVRVTVADAGGTLQPNAGPMVKYAVSGPGVIAGLGSSDPVLTEPYQGSQRSVFRGVGLAIVKSTGKSGRIVLTAQADGLKPAETVIRAE
jgi:beta-galactosidase